MEIIDLSPKDLKFIRPKIFRDDRGYFFESFNQDKFTTEAMQIKILQINQSGSQKGVLRGLHYQIDNPQGKLVRALTGSVFDVAVDLRKSSSTFGQWEGVYLHSEEHSQLWIPAGFAHGFLVLSDWADIEYATTDFYSPDGERTIRWNDSDIAIIWPLETIGTPILSGKDAKGASFADAEKFE